MRGTKFPLQGWRIVGFTVLTVGTIVGVISLFHGIDEQGMRMVIRATARTSTIALRAYVRTIFKGSIHAFSDSLKFF